MLLSGKLDLRGGRSVAADMSVQVTRAMRDHSRSGDGIRTNGRVKGRATMDFIVTLDRDEDSV